MQVETKNEKECIVEVTVKVDAEEIKGANQKVVTMFVRNGTIPGFRRGKAPTARIKQYYATEIANETKREVYQQFWPKAQEEAKLETINTLGIKEITCSEEAGATFTVAVEVKPQFDLPKYTKLAIKEAKMDVSKEQVEEQIENERTMFAKYEDAKDGDKIEDGDFVQINYTGVKDIKDKTPLIEIAPEAKAVASGKDFWTQVEEGRFVPEILEALKGMTKGEKKDDIKVKFPKDNAPEALKGLKASYEVEVVSFRKRVKPDDAELLKKVEKDSMDAYKADVKARLEKEAEAAAAEARNNQAIELLLKKADFEVPNSLVQRQMEQYLSDFAQRAQQMGITGDYIAKNKEKIVGDARTNAIKQVRLSYILLAIATAENLTGDDEAVKAALEKLAANYNGKVTADELRANLEKQGQLELYREQVRAERALKFVVDNAK